MPRRKQSVPLICLLAIASLALQMQSVWAQQVPPPDLSGTVQGLDPQLDPQLTSRTIYATGQVNPTTAHPWVGFWKLSCKDEFGLAIVSAKPGWYSALFCGPFACTKPGTFLPDTPMVGDADYRLDSPNQIGVLDRNKKFNAHTRCLVSP